MKNDRRDVRPRRKARRGCLMKGQSGFNVVSIHRARSYSFFNYNFLKVIQVQPFFTLRKDNDIFLL